METEDGKKDFDRPVAYTPDGEPLYAHPQTNTAPAPAETQIIHMTRSMEPVKQEIPPEMKEKHDQSVERYPHLDLSEHEYVILSVRRHIIGMLPAMAFGAILFLVILFVIFSHSSIESFFGVAYAADGTSLTLFGILSCVVLGMALYIVWWVYVNNLFFLTNESVIEKTQLTPFSSNVKSVGLGDVVDVSYRQTGIIEHILNFGTVQVGTKDDEVPYIFNYVNAPKKQASILKEAVEAFKNGRAIREDDLDV